MAPCGPGSPGLTSVFSLVIGMERIFHLDEMEDAGFARLCGGRRCPSRHTVGPGAPGSAPALVRGGRLLPAHLSLELAPQRGRAHEFRRAHHPALDAEIPHRQGLQHHPQQVHALREIVHGLRPGQRPFPERAWHAGQRELARLGRAVGATGLESGPTTQFARSVRCRRGQVGRGRAGLVELGRAIPPLGCHDARLSLPAPHADLEAITQRPVRVGPRPGRVCRRPTQGGPPGRDADGAQGRGSGASHSHDHLSRGSSGSQERSLAPAVHDERSRRTRSARSLVGLSCSAKPRARPSRRGARPIGGCGAVWLRQGEVPIPACRDRVFIGVPCK